MAWHPSIFVLSCPTSHRFPRLVYRRLCRVSFKVTSDISMKNYTESHFCSIESTLRKQFIINNPNIFAPPRGINCLDEADDNFSPCVPQQIWIFNSLRPSDGCMRHQPGPSSVQITACRLFGAKPLSEPMLSFWQLDPWEQTSLKIKSKLKYF